ncbi:methyltransferase [Luteimicrobium xylanilyticum]|uniref:16S rRNA (Guanine(1207)-N(2))-methyltransferase n=1 Tax=Luteimicrobium xylanilyticum TaxID=1133546 RepID=A0A5P9QA15_9MICO|nr:methyltransferase [Luteimicrobium xylanilyticum]QFU97970.1 16S rRNA (guanine(1207)-N(2))-methyltransferase [Luteimicrobium xylanilyticum]
MSEQPDHYFTARPASSGERRTLTVRLAGRDVEVETAGGVFSPGRVDLGTQVLLRTVPELPAHATDVLDLGCGWGPVALTMALEARDRALTGTRIWAVDVNERSLDLVRRNAARLGLAHVDARLPDDVPDDARFDTIWSNPPIRVGKEALHGLLTRWLPRLRPGGDAWLVVQRNLGADSLQGWLADWLAGHQEGATVERAASAKGFRVLRVHQP